MPRVDPSRPRKRAPKPPGPTLAQVVARTKGTAAGPIETRWTVHERVAKDAPPAPPLEVSNDPAEPSGYTVFIAARLHYDARSAARVFLSRFGLSFDKVELFEVRPFQANGWTPPRAVLVTPKGSDIDAEWFDFDALAKAVGA